jgi:SP family arabinose:H+ symporter-like MFS transporter
MAIINTATFETSNSTFFHNRSFIFVISAIAALGGVLFGFDLVIISGTIPFFTGYFHLGEAGTGWAVGCINLGAAVGALIAGKLSDVLGRKKLLLFCAFLFAFTGFATGWATNFSFFIGARLLSGVAVGIAALVCPVYIAEIAPGPLRGRLVTFYQLAIVTGLLIAYLSNYLLLNSGINNWRWMFSSQSLPALLFLFGLLFVPESPRWLIKKKNNEKALNTLRKIGGNEYADHEAALIAKSFDTEIKGMIADLFKPGFLKIIMLGVVIAVFSQADGQNSLFSYAPVIFKAAGMPENTAFLQSVILGVVNFIFTFVAIKFIDQAGRKKLLLYGAILLCFDALALSCCFYVGAPGYFMLFFVVGFIAIYAATLGPVTWVLLSEIFPNLIRGYAMGLATLSLWIANFFTTASFPLLKKAFGLPVTFMIHAAICFVYFLFIRSKIPETKGKSLEEITDQLLKK